MAVGAVERGVNKGGEEAEVLGDGGEPGAVRLEGALLRLGGLDLEEVLAVGEEEELAGVEEAEEGGGEEVEGPGVGGGGGVAEKGAGGDGLEGVEEREGHVEELLLQAEQRGRGGHDEAAVHVLHQRAAAAQHGGLQPGARLDGVERGGGAAGADEHLGVLLGGVCDDGGAEAGDEGEQLLHVGNAGVEEGLVLEHQEVEGIIHTIHTINRREWIN